MDGAQTGGLYATARLSTLAWRVGERGAGVEGQAVRPALEPALVQILVIVANIQMRTLKAEVEKGSA